MVIALSARSVSAHEQGHAWPAQAIGKLRMPYIGSYSSRGERTVLDIAEHGVVGREVATIGHSV